MITNKGTALKTFGSANTSLKIHVNGALNVGYTLQEIRGYELNGIVKLTFEHKFCVKNDSQTTGPYPSDYPLAMTTHFNIQLYIYSKIILSMDRHDWFEKYIACPFCRNDWSVLNYTKTDHLMLRCDDCKLLIFANSPDSEDQLIRFCNIPKLSSCKQECRLLIEQDQDSSHPSFHIL